MSVLPPGETIKIICDISNASSRTATPKVNLLQKQFYYTHNRVHKRMVPIKLASVTGQPVSAHTSDVQTQIKLTIPPTASVSISNCSILNVEYLIEVGSISRYYKTLEKIIHLHSKILFTT